MEPQSQPGDRRAWIALGLLGLAALIGLAILLDVGPFGDGELSESEFAAQGDDVCVEAHEDFEELQEAPPRTASEARRLTEELVAIARDERDAIADLSEPSELEELVDRYLEARDEGIELIEAGLEAAEADDARAYERAQAELAAGQRERERLARRIGFEECSRVLFGAG